MWLPLTCSLLGTWPATQACALTGNRTGNPLVCRPALNPLSHASQGSFLAFITHVILLGGHLGRLRGELHDRVFLVGPRVDPGGPVAEGGEASQSSPPSHVYDSLDTPQEAWAPRRAPLDWHGWALLPICTSHWLGITLRRGWPWGRQLSASEYYRAIAHFCTLSRTS